VARILAAAASLRMAGAPNEVNVLQKIAGRSLLMSDRSQPRGALLAANRILQENVPW